MERTMFVEFAFITSFDEVVVSSFISGGETLVTHVHALRDHVAPTISAIRHA